MNALVKKEIRLLLPAWGIALALALGAWLLAVLEVRFSSHSSAHFSEVILFVFGPVMAVFLALNSFGRELGSGILTSLLAQPVSRARIWRTKTLLLAAATFTFWSAWWLVFNQHPNAPAAPGERHQIILITALSSVAAYAGGLWTVLLFRQVTPAFWFTLIIPAALATLVFYVSDRLGLAHLTEAGLIGVFVIYSTAGFVWARRLFLRAQDIAWTGGNVSLPGLARWLPWLRSATSHRKSHPILALLGKEVQFQQINFLLAGLLLLVQLAALMLQKLVNTSEHSLLDMLVQNFWGIWIIMPLLVGCGAVAEERKLGTLDSQLCLPVSRAWQFAVKVFVTLACGVVLGAVVPVVLTFIHPTGVTRGGDFVVGWTLACASLALVSLYASSLTNQILQAFGAAIGILVIGFVLGNWFSGNFSGGERQFTLFGFELWRGPLVVLIGAGVMLVAAMILAWRQWRWGCLCIVGLFGLLVVWAANRTWTPASVTTESQMFIFGVRSQFVILVSALYLCPLILTLALAARNFDRLQPSLSLWRRNAAIWMGCFVITGVINTLVYNRAWEVLMRFEPPAGSPRLSGSVQPAITPMFIGRPTVVLLPDGRLCSYNGYERIPSPVTQNKSNQSANHEPNWRVVEKPSIEFIGGSNWVTIATAGREILGVKSDGSLWRSYLFEGVDQEGNVIPLYVGSPKQKGLKVRATGLRFERFGTEFDWAMVAASSQHWVALKRDGTIWGWGDNVNRQLGDAPRFVTNALVQIGTESNWVAVFASPGHTLAVNGAGDIWKWGKFTTDNWGRETEQGPVKLNLKVAGVRSVASENFFDLILDTDGNLWGLGRIPRSFTGGMAFQFHTTPRKLSGENWSIVDLKWQGFAGLKNDGTLWNQPVSQFLEGRSLRPVRLGKRTDWVAVSKEWDSVLAVAKDGTIYRFGQPTLGPDLELLAPTRRVTWSLNLLDGAK